MADNLNEINNLPDVYAQAQLFLDRSQRIISKLGLIQEIISPYNNETTQLKTTTTSNVTTHNETVQLAAIYGHVNYIIQYLAKYLRFYNKECFRCKPRRRA